MFKWLLNLFRPHLLYIVYNEEDCVGSFFQAAFYDEDEAEDYIEKLQLAHLKKHNADMEFFKEEFDAGRYPAVLYQPDTPFIPLKLRIEVYDLNNPTV